MRGGIGGREAQIGVARVLAVGVGRARAGEDDARLPHQRPDALGAAVHQRKADEIAAVRLCPGSDPEPAELGLQRLKHDVKLRADDVGVALHDLVNVRGALQVARLPQLIQLVEADGLHADELLRLRHVGGRKRHRGDAAAREGHLRGRGEGEDAILRAVALAEFKDVRQLLLAVDVVDAVGIVPDDAEVGRGAFHLGQTAHDLARIGHAGRVGVLRHTDDALDRGVLRQLLDALDVGLAVRTVFHRDHLDAERFQHPEVAVIAGGRADEPDFIQSAPRLVHAGGAVQHQPRERVVNHVEARIAADEDLLRRDLKQLGKQRLCLGNAVEQAVVSVVEAPLADVVAVLARKRGEQLVRQIELLADRLAARQVERQLQLAEAVKFDLRALQLFFLFFYGKLCVFHNAPLGSWWGRLKNPPSRSFSGRPRRRGCWRRR